MKNWPSSRSVIAHTNRYINCWKQKTKISYYDDFTDKQKNTFWHACLACYKLWKERKNYVMYMYFIKFDI